MLYSKSSLYGTLWWRETSSLLQNWKQYKTLDRIGPHICHTCPQRPAVIDSVGARTRPAINIIGLLVMEWMSLWWRSNGWCDGGVDVTMVTGVMVDVMEEWMSLWWWSNGWCDGSGCHYGDGVMVDVMEEWMSLWWWSNGWCDGGVDVTMVMGWWLMWWRSGCHYGDGVMVDVMEEWVSLWWWGDGWCDGGVDVTMVMGWWLMWWRWWMYIR